MKRFKIYQFPFFYVIFICFGPILSAQKFVMKVACIGDSVTAGYLLTNPNTESYPSQLQLLLGYNYEVRNFGHSGATLLKNGHKPYYKTQEFVDALAFSPDIAIIHLGLNDTDPRNWPNYKEEFTADYSYLIDELKRQNPVVKIYICQMTPIFNEHPRFKSGTRDWYWQIQSKISNIAKTNQVSLIDLHEKLYARPDLFPDALHPNKEGASILAMTVSEAITQNFGGLKIGPVFNDNMVLQRNQSIPIYGTANRGDLVEVYFKGQKKTVVTNEYGKWEVIFPAQVHGGPYEINIKSNSNTLILKNILLGDVWFFSGQSNMAFSLQESENGNEELKKSLPNVAIRLFNFKTLRETDNTVWDSITLTKTNRLEFFSGQWTACDTTNAKDFSAIAYYFGKKIVAEENVPVGLIQVAVGGSPIESWIDRYTLEHDNKVVDVLTNWRKSDFIMPWVRTRGDLNLQNATNPKQRHPYDPAYNFESGVKYFTKFPIKGVVWYQGESNAHNIELYEHLFPTMVESWRKSWNTNFPFYYVQLSSINRPTWPDFRNAQNKMQKIIPNSAMAVSMDYGDSTNVHPAQKKEIADRLVLLALRNTYKKAIVANGPEPINVSINREQLIISFNYAKKLISADKNELIGFELVTGKGKHIPVHAKAVKNKILINIPKGENIKSVRYAYQPFTRANLVNEVGLPCSTFKIELQ